MEAEVGDKSMYVGLKGASCPSHTSQAGFTDEGRATVSGTTIVSDPEYRYVPAQYVDAEIRQIIQRIGDFNNANGLCVVISCEKGYKLGEPVPNIHQSGREFDQLFQMFGYATYHLRNPTKNDIKALYRALATKIEYPSSYKRLVFFYTGHGFSDHISTEDGHISIYEIVANFWTQNAPNISGIPKIFIFDCCRTEHPERLPVSSRDSADQMSDFNIYILYTTLPRTESYTRGGASIPTAKLVEILKDKNHNFLELNRVLHNKIREEIDNRALWDHMNPVSRSAVYQQICFHQEREEAMKPTNLRVRSDMKETEFTWTAPEHAERQHLLKYDVCISKQNARIRKFSVHRSQSSFRKSTRIVENCIVYIQATYKDGTVVKSDSITIPCRWTVKRFCIRCKENTSLWCLVIVSLSLLALLSLIFLVVTTGFLETKRSNASPSRQLIVANQIITHPMLHPSWLNTLWYSGVTLQQSPLPASDNLRGIPVTIIYSKQTHVVTQETMLTDIYPPLDIITRPNEMVIFPLNYISMPLYFVQNSVIFFQLSIILPTAADSLRDAQVYIFDFYENIPPLPDKSILSRALKKFNVTDAASKTCTFNYTVAKASYLYFALKINTSANCYTLFSNLTVDLKSFNFEGSAPGNSRRDTIYLGEVKYVNFQMFPPLKGIYLYAHPVEDSERSLVHLTLQWKDRKWFQYGVTAIFALGLLLFCILSAIGTVYKCRWKCFRTRYTRLRTLSDISQNVSIHDDV